MNGKSVICACLLALAMAAIGCEPGENYDMCTSLTPADAKTPQNHEYIDMMADRADLSRDQEEEAIEIWFEYAEKLHELVLERNEERVDETFDELDEDEAVRELDEIIIREADEEFRDELEELLEDYGEDLLDICHGRQKRRMARFLGEYGLVVRTRWSRLAAATLDTDDYMDMIDD
jgi:hypothetical protein